ncbi:alkylation response protein AidB-like acyl-CoA dehydrogenase [Paraburkholderia sp. Cpub6]|nr:alkylation response protein AidB-like acyl-CoA dehydrogenase [Paraburkholderia sp. Cpub6]
MRAIDAADLALELMIERAQSRRTFGKALHEHGTIGEWIAKSRAEIDQVTVLVLAVDHIDGNAVARKLCEVGFVADARVKQLFK